MYCRRAGIDSRENRRANPKEAGFTLIEVLFAVIFLSIGLLGIAAMQDIALSRNVDGRRMTVATNLAAEMLERIRYNAVGNSKPLPAGSYLYNGILACVPGPGCAAPNPGNAVAVPGLAGSATAAGDFAQWNAALAAVDSNGVLLLPGAIGTVSAVAVDPLNPSGPTSLEQVRITVTVGWVAGLRTPTITMSSVVAPL